MLNIESFLYGKGYWVHGKKDWRSWKEHEEEQWQTVKSRAWSVFEGTLYIHLMLGWLNK